MLSVARSRLAVPFQLTFLGVNGIALLVGSIYNNKTPDLYENNSHHKLGWIITWIVIAQSLMAVTKLCGGRSGSYGKYVQEQSFGSTPVSVEAIAQHQQMQQRHEYLHDIGHGSDSDTSRTSSMSGTTDCEDSPARDYHQKQDDESEADYTEKRSLLGNGAVDRFLSRVPFSMPNRVMTAIDVAHTVIDRVILLLGFLATTTGVVVYGGVFRGNNVFNGLAHFIKGGIFFWYGLLTLGRWMGCFAELGWAWNIKPPTGVVSARKARIPSAEFVESFVIFLYGSTNVFLEHLAAWGEAWTAQDLEHVSISIMFFGGGLCGMLVESKRIRDLLNTSILSSPANGKLKLAEEPWIPPKTYGISMNPFPALIILLLGVMMSSHHQDSMVSTMVHKQWGYLFVGFALARATTYILTYLSPPTSYLPSRPPSEIITSFCLISGGLVFMTSNKDTVAAMEHHDLNAMFALTVTVGFTAFLMAWTILALAIKGWANRRHLPRNSTLNANAALA
ncbi:MAG: hypothetical protein Q9191_007755 [Dirinaria sp. TL-2023a]